MLSEMLLQEVDKADAIILAAQEVIDGKLNEQFLVDPFQAGAGTSHHMNINEVIANRATQLLGGIIMGKSATYEDPPEDNQDVFDKQIFYFTFDTNVDKIKKEIFNQLEAISKLEDPECNVIE